LLNENSLILVSTLGGSLVAIEKKTGDVRWKLLNGKLNIKVVPRSIQYKYIPEHCFTTNKTFV